MALRTPGVQGFSMRVGWNEIDTNFSILDQGLAVAQSAHVSFSVRFMAGEFTPAQVFVDGSPYYTLPDASKVPIPFMPNGSPNLVFQTAYLALVAKLAAWAKDNNVHLLHLSNYGQFYSEINFGIQIRQSPGFSTQNWLNAEYQLIDGSIPYAGPDLALEMPMSGYGPVIQVVPSLVAHINEEAAEHSAPFFIEANGWDQSGFFGSTDEQNLDAVFQTPVQRGVQMINAGSYDWPALYQLADSIHPTFVEVYLPSFLGSGSASLDQQVQSFRNTACA